jgi:outer membrane lipoprotein-sorting protein
MSYRLLATLAALTLATPALAQGDAKGSALVSQFLAAYGRCSAFTAKLDVLTREGKQESHMALKMVYARPQNIALTVVDSKEFPMSNGTTVTWLGASRARVSTHFFGAPLAITLPVKDNRICNLRGYSLQDVSLGSEIPMLQDPSTHVKYVGPATIAGRAAECIEARGPKLLRGIERELIWLDRSTRFPLLREMYEAGRVVYRMALTQYEFNPQLPAALFAAF